MSGNKNQIILQLETFLLEDNGMIVAYCPSLELSSYGDTIDDAKKAFDEVVDIFLEDTIQKGTLEKVLLKLGWTLKGVPKPMFEPPRLDTSDIKRISKNFVQSNKAKVSIPAYC